VCECDASSLLISTCRIWHSLDIQLPPAIEQYHKWWYEAAIWTR